MFTAYRNTPLLEVPGIQCQNSEPVLQKLRNDGVFDQQTLLQKYQASYSGEVFSPYSEPARIFWNWIANIFLAISYNDTARRANLVIGWASERCHITPLQSAN